MGQWDTVCAVCEATVDVVPAPRIPIPASVLVGAMALLLLAFAIWAYQPWNLLLAAVPTPTAAVPPTPTAVETPVPVAPVQPTIIPTPQFITITYTVQPGETLRSIARKYNTTAEAIMQANHLTSLVIYAVQKLLIPVPPAGAPTPTPRRHPVVHVVQPGEYLELIADHYGVTVRAIKDANKLTSDLIHPGQKLVIPVPAPG